LAHLIIIGHGLDLEFIFTFSMIESRDIVFLKLRKKKTNLRKWKEWHV